MSLKVIYVVRHGFRSNWLVDPNTGDYKASVPSPTGIASDPTLTSHGVNQAKELGKHLDTLEPPVEVVYSSPYYRCLQTLSPFTSQRCGVKVGSGGLPAVRVEAGIAEWYGTADFEHPIPASLDTLREFFPEVDGTYTSAVQASRKGESIPQLHDRVAAAMDAIITRCDKEGKHAVLLSSHAATIIALGRVLTGKMPENIEEEDFAAFTCGLSVYHRRKAGERSCPIEDTSGTRTNFDNASHLTREAQGSDQSINWRNGVGVGGGWTCEKDSDCSFLSGGEERGWRFSGDESFGSVNSQGSLQSDAGIELGVVVEKRHTSKGGTQEASSARPSRL